MRYYCKEFLFFCVINFFYYSITILYDLSKSNTNNLHLIKKIWDKEKIYTNQELRFAEGYRFALFRLIQVGPTSTKIYLFCFFGQFWWTHFEITVFSLEKSYS